VTVHFTTINNHCSNRLKVTVTTGNRLSLLQYHYSGSTIAMDISHPLLLWSVAVTDIMTSSIRRYCGM
jgi:hypothetical protein